METYTADRLFGDNWSCAFFGALTPVGALFVFTEAKEEERKMKKILKTVIVCFALFAALFAMSACMKEEDYYTKADVSNLVTTLEGEIESCRSEYNTSLAAV